ncbi:uncharacterized protein LOC120718418 [Simochromis diagramma]|uniref:uncharacterized protein LOC120718418 n=1 Tax=Simochromis diagramma TaxID=43689 RepID=UPI001A7E4428|nr:uncharacterized protein LOC120718418 [Simochromis diagramma]
MKGKIIISIFLSLCIFARTQSVYEAKEGSNITIRLDRQLQADLSLAHLMCVFLSDNGNTLFKMIRGVEDSESQHEQFAGRVQIDRDALRGGRVVLCVSRVTAEDSGNYRCDLAADYNKVLRRWEHEVSENFILNVTLLHSVSSDGFHTTPEQSEGARSPEEKRRAHDWNNVKTVLGVLNVGALILGGLVLVIEEANRHLQAIL